jgi:xylulokinase
LKTTRLPSSSILGVSFAAQSNSLVPIDREGRALTPCITTYDSRSEAETAFFAKKVGEERIYTETGVNARPQSGITKILWLKKYRPNIYRRTWQFLDCKDYVEHWLTGKIATDQTSASFYGIIDVHKKRWSESLAAALDLPLDRLPDIFESTHVMGEIEAAKASLLHLRKGTPVVSGGTDVTSAAIGVGGATKNAAHLCVGTSGWLGFSVSRIAKDRKRRLVYLCHNDPSRWVAVGAMDTAGACMTWCKDRFFTNEEKRTNNMENVFDVIDSEAMRSSSASLIFIPYLLGEMWVIRNLNARGALIGLGIEHTRGDVARAIMEGVAFHMRLTLEILERLYSRVKIIACAGGGARSRTWMQVHSNVLSRRINAPDYPQYAGALGAALTGAIGIGAIKSFKESDELFVATETYKPDSEISRVYDKAFQLFNESYARLVPVYRGLREIHEAVS